MSKISLQTQSVRGGLCSDHAHGAVMPPLHLSTNFTFDGIGGQREYDYTRSGNPTRDLLGNVITELEGGAGTIVTSSGMSALTLLTHLVENGGKVLAPHDCYGGTFRLLNALTIRKQIEASYVDFGDLVAVEEALKKDVDLVVVESPSNPLLRVVDIRAIAGLCHKYAAIFAVDNTFLSPALQRPIELGADIVVHSTTKYLNGHSDVVGGSVTAKNQDVYEKLKWWANCTGVTGSPFDSYLTLRGVRTLEPRMRLHLENTSEIVNLLLAHPVIKKVYYPGLKNHPGHEIALRQQKGFGAIVSFELYGTVNNVKALVDGLKYFTLAESLGGVESLIAHPATMTHASMTPEARARAGITEGLIRLSVGIESADDLALDLKEGLDRALRLHSGQSADEART